VKELQTVEKDDTDTSTKRPTDEGAVSLNGNDVLIRDRRLKMIQEHDMEDGDMKIQEV